MKKHILVLALGSAMVLSACGGGGGGSGGGSTPGSGTVGTGGGTTTPPTTPPATSTLSTITDANATSVAANAYAATTSVGASSASLTDILTGVSVTKVNLNTVAPLIALAKRAYEGPQLLTGIVNSRTCSGGGTLSVDATVASSSNISNGDTMKITANACVESGETLSGTLSIKFSGVSGNINTSVFGATMDSTFTAFTISSASDKITVDGDMKLTLNQTSSTANTIQISGTSLKTSEQTGTAAVINRNVTAYTVSGKTEGSTTTSAANFGLSGNSTSLGNFSYTVKNLAAFVSTGNAAPTSGSLIVNGNASAVTASAVSNGVQVNFSNNGTTTTSSKTVDWTTFLNSI